MQGTRESIGLALALGLTAVSGVSQAAVDCAGLAAVTSEASTMTSAAVVTPPATINGVAVTVPMCRVQGTARPTSDSEIKFEVWLPATAAAWTGRMKVNGTGGFAGATPYARLGQDIGDGFVTAGSNMGHDGGESATWTLNHPDKVKDWGLRAHYYVATAAKTLSQAFYDRPVAHSYFEGCSNGGRQAMMMAQNYPELFDGIVAGAPSMFYPDILFWLLWTGKHLTPVFGQPAALSTAKRNLITERVLAACDANDGLVDRQITNPRACSFDIDTFGPAGDNSLTAQELAIVKAMYAGTTNEVTGEQRYAGAALGSEANFDPNFADNGGYGVFIGHYVYSTLDWTTANWRDKINFSSVYDHTKSFISPVTAAPSPDIRAFTSRGGKIVHYHGWNDSVVPPDGSIAYLHALTQFEKLQHLPRHAFDHQVEKLSPQVVAATAQAFGKRVQEYHRLFLLPAVSHCGGGTGPNAIGGGAPEPTANLRDAEHHTVSAVIKWVEEGVAPEKIVASRIVSGAVVRSRPVCPYPAQAAYNGSGSIDDAANFSCVTPKLQERTIGFGDVMLIQNSLRQRDLKLPNR
jgi:feruloyl esterase